MQKTYFFAYIICGFYSFLTMNLAGKDMSIREIEIVRTKKGNSLLLPHIVISIIILIPHQFPKHFFHFVGIWEQLGFQNGVQWNGWCVDRTYDFYRRIQRFETILLYTSR
jgi:hypothetical protein